MTTQQMRAGLSRALELIGRGDNAEALSLLRELAERLEGDGWRGLALTLRLTAAELRADNVAAAREHWFEAWGYVAALDHVQRQRA
jgi:hypothetical protein